jgi:hypothetical protein
LPTSASIDLSTQANAFGGNVSLGNSTLPSYQIRDTDAFVVGNVTATTLTINTTGDITQNTGTVLSISGTTTLTADTGNITLSNTTNDFGTVNITSGNVTTLVDASALVLGTTTTTTLNVTANGTITQTGALTVSGVTTLAAGTNDITLGNTTNSFTGLVNVTSAQDLTINTTSALNLGDVAASSVTVNGGAVTVTGNITQTNINGATISGFGANGTGSQWVNNQSGSGTPTISNNILTFNRNVDTGGIFSRHSINGIVCKATICGELTYWNSTFKSNTIKVTQCY